MANRESILFAPEISERDLDREVDNVNDQLSGVGEDVPVNFDADEMDMGGLMPAGAGSGGGGGGMGGGSAAGVGALASKIPKPVAGVTASAALPIAISGAIGAGLLSEMGKASARMQTSARILGIARDNFFREPGNVFDEHITRPLSEDILAISQDFDDAMREGRPGEAIAGALADAFPNNTETGSWLNLIDTIVTINNRLNSVDMGWIDVVSQSWPGWPEIGDLWPEWPDIQTDWPEWPEIQREWPEWPNVKSEWESIGWPDIGTPSWPSAGMILRQFPSISTSALRDAILGDRSGGGGGSSSGGSSGKGGGWLPDIPFLASGGRVQRTGAAVVHRNEIVADPDRLVSELASAVSQSSGGRTRSMDAGGLERRLDRLHDDLRRLESALDVTVQVGREEIGRAAAKGKRQDISDSNPRV